MVFNSVSFVIYLIVVVSIYYFISQRVRHLWLLAASYYFYMQWNVKYTLLIVITTIVTYLSALWIEKLSGQDKKRKAVLVICIFLNIGILFIFKYLQFVVDNICRLLSEFGVTDVNLVFNIILPAGISFYTFQAIGYVLDVYSGKIRAERNLGYYAVFVSFFPQLVAGPIEAAEDLLPQFREEHRIDKADFLQGFRFLLFGMFKKVAIADVCAMYVNEVYNDLYTYSGVSILIATLLFTIQIYCDFSGYSDIARGAALILGFRLSENFSAPYFSESVTEFWRRWHITLGRWFREYVYIPLGGNRRGGLRVIFNVFIVWLVTGLWHGASWHFIVWGVYYGILVVIERGLKRFKKNRIKLGTILSVCVTMIFVVMGWGIFRVNSLTDLCVAAGKILLSFHPESLLIEAAVIEQKIFFKSETFAILYGFTLVTGVYLLGRIDFIYKYRMKFEQNVSFVFAKWGVFKRRLVYYYMALMTIIWFVIENSSYFDTPDFIYFQF